MTGICVVTIICFLKGKKGFVHDMSRDNEEDICMELTSGELGSQHSSFLLSGHLED